MHITAERLFDALKLVAKVDGRESPGAVADFLKESPAVITNWKSRGVSKAGQLKVHAMTGISPTWLATGEGDMLPAGTAQASDLIEQGSGEISLTRALEVVASALQGADALSQMQARPLLQHLMEHPDQAEQIAPRLAVLLGKPPVPAVETSDFAGQPSIALPFQKTKNSA